LKFESKFRFVIARKPPATTRLSSPGLTGRSSMLRYLDWTRLSLEYWVARSSRAMTRDVIAGLDPAIHPLRKTLLKFDGYAGQARV
jgi:hypothetical protein